MASLNPSTQYRRCMLQVWETFDTKDAQKLQKSLHIPEPFQEPEELRDICDTEGLLALDKMNDFIKIIDESDLKKASRILRNFKRKYITQTDQLDEQCSVHGSKKLIFICLSCQERLCQDCKIVQHAKSCEAILTLEEYFEEINKTYEQISKKVSSAEQIIASVRSKQKNYRRDLYSDRTSVSQLLKQDYDDIIKKAEMEKSKLLEDISIQELSKSKTLLEIQLQLEDVNRTVKTTKDPSLIQEDMPNRIKKATEKLKILNQVDKDLNKIIELLRKSVTDITYICNEKDGVFGEITLLKPYKITMIEEKSISRKTDTLENFTTQIPLLTTLPNSQSKTDKTSKGFKGLTSTRDTCNEKIKSPGQLQTFNRLTYFSKSTSDISKEEDKSSLGMRENPHGSYVDISRQKRYTIKNKYKVRTLLPKR